MIKIGTSGYSYSDWKGIFYPDSLSKKDYLKHYANFFGITEINSTYYRIPRPGMFKSIIKKAPKDFSFTVKLSKEFTHERQKAASSVDSYKRGIEPLLDSGQLMTLLAQFPYSFKPNKQNYSHLENIRQAFANLPINVEFRNKYWITDKTFSFLREHDFGYVCVDMPNLPNLVPPIVKATTDLGYVRFHGRVKKHWWNPPQPHMRYDYLYEEEELEEWVNRSKKLDNETENVVIMFNNHFQGKSAKNARQFSSLLSPEKKQPKEPENFINPPHDLFNQ